ncbi:SGNH/GDSL hydrolase family protein [Bartonella heixiaziensis]|uniref:SGNH/GDSL hydrolase family protein n=1 Tax=Bartonella heixiaziensis TaxID=1461000 RepID=UPI003908BBCA
MSYFRSIHLIFLFFSLFAASIIQSSPSKATNFFKWLLDHNKQEQPQQQPQTTKQKVYQPKKKAVIQKPVQTLKDTNAKRILVIGDFLASTAANELKKLFTDDTDIIIINNAVPSSGLVRTDHTSWKNSIPELIEKNKPDAIVMIIGANDNQPISDSHGVFNPLQPEWMNIYKQRIIEITERLHNSGKPWIWMGQPAFESNNLTQKIQTFNELYKNATEAAGGYFINIWDGFINAQGQFSFSGYDINGKITRLRTNDGINFTFEGKRKLVSYLRKPLETILNLPVFSHEDTHLTNVNTLQPVQGLHNIERQPPISLDEMAQQNTHLLNKVDQSLIKKSWSSPNGHQKERADNFSFP